VAFFTVGNACISVNAEGYLRDMNMTAKQ